MVTLGILDYAQIDEDSHAVQALENSVELAEYAESLGFERFWMAEHHNVPAFASSSPELMMMRIADRTKWIRVGSGGVMLPHYSPYKVAENFRVLEGFHAGRIDLGIGNTIGTPIVNQALNETKQSKLSYRQSIDDVMKYLSNQIDESHRFFGAEANPSIPTTPEMWVLSTSIQRAKMAGQMGIGFTYGYFLTGMEHAAIGMEAVKVYRESFIPSPFMPKPKVMIAPLIVLAETMEETEAYKEALDVWLLGKEHFRYFKQFPSVATARAYTCTDREKEIIQTNRKKMIVGDKEHVQNQLHQLVEKFTADELLAVLLLPTFAARKVAAKLLKEMF